MSEQALSALIDCASQGGHLVALTGAGISAESGIPTFRDAQSGLWSQYSPEELATPQAFEANPKLVWDWYRWRRSLIAKATPNAGHVALAKMEAHFNKFILITQNVDGFHRLAGSSNPIEVHGNIWITKCSHCDHEKFETPDQALEREEIPTCPACQANLRPGVIWFGEALSEHALQASFEAAQACDLLLSIGTSSVVYPTAMLPEIALAQGARVIEINPQETPLSANATYAVRGSAGVVLPKLVDALESNSRS